MKIKEIMYEIKVQSGLYLFNEGDKADKLYYIYEGQINLTKVTDEGNPFILFKYEDGDLFGQLEPFIDSIHSFNAEVTKNSTIGVIYWDDLELLLNEHGELAVEFMKWMGLQLRMTQARLRDLLLFGKLGALCSQLIRLNNQYGQPYGEYHIISKRFTNATLAEMIGSTREVVNRMLGRLRKEGIISYENGCIVLKDINYLRDICQCENCPMDICRI